MSFFKDLENAVVNDVQKLETALKIVASEVVDFLKPLLDEILSEAGQVVIKTFEQTAATVIANPHLITDGGNGLSQVETMALNSLKANGIKAGVNVLNVAKAAVEAKLNAAALAANQAAAGPAGISGAQAS